MTLAVKHNFVTTKTDGTDPTLLRPSNWNESHNITLATATLIGRQSAGDGAAEEIPCSALAATILAATDFAALAALGVSFPTTGDGKFTFKTVADPGWVMMNDSEIGNAASGSNGRANDDALPLFTLLFNNVNDANAPLVTTSGGILGAGTTRAAQGSAATAFANNCRMLLPRQLGRAIVSAGTGGGITGLLLGTAFGEAVHTLTPAEIPSITSTNSSAVGFSASGSISGSTSSVVVGGSGIAANSGNGFTNGNASVSGSASVSGAISEHTIPIGSTNTGGGAHNNTQASTAWNVMVKL